MLKGGHDQAAGLRRLFAPRRIPVIAVVGGQGGAGATHVACALAVHLAALRLAVTLIDEHRGERSAATVLGARVRYDLAQAVQGDVRYEQVVSNVADRLQLVTAARLADGGDFSLGGTSSHFADCWNGLLRHSDVVLIDARLHKGGRLSKLADKAGTVVVVATAGSAGVTGSYLRLKAISREHPDAQAGIIVNRAESAAQAAAIHENMDGLARKQHGRGIELFGALPAAPIGRRPAASNSEVSSLVQRLLPGLLEPSTSPFPQMPQQASNSMASLASIAALAV